MGDGFGPVATAGSPISRMAGGGSWPGLCRFTTGLKELHDNPASRTQGFMSYRNWRVTSVSPPGSKREEVALTQPNTQNQIDHIAYVVDASASMEDRTEETITVIDNQTAFLAEMSKQTGRETRVTIYIFSDPHNVKCVVFDKDVLRLPSIREFYHPEGWTALLDATGLAIEDLKMTMQKYGDHAFLLFAFTDGQENKSQQHTAHSLSTMIKGLGNNWTVAALVPDVNGMLMARRFGFPDGNISIWNVHSKTGVEEAGETMKAALASYSGLRSAGGSGTRTLFSTDPTAVNAATIKAAELAPLPPGTYDLVKVARIKAGEGTLNKDKKPCWEIKAFLEHNGLRFVLGRNYYRMNKQEIIAGDKELAIREQATNRVYVGPGVRAMIGLSDQKQRVAPDKNPDYDIFVQSKSNNRYLFHGDEILVLK